MEQGKNLSQQRKVHNKALATESDVLEIYTCTALTLWFAGGAKGNAGECFLKPTLRMICCRISYKSEAKIL